ncbi:hypothetical protein Save01_06235 [Streptomyces avermitilis]
MSVANGRGVATPPSDPWPSGAGPFGSATAKGPAGLHLRPRCTERKEGRRITPLTAKDTAPGQYGQRPDVREVRTWARARITPRCGEVVTSRGHTVDFFSRPLAGSDAAAGAAEAGAGPGSRLVTVGARTRPHRERPRTRHRAPSAGTRTGSPLPGIRTRVRPHGGGAVPGRARPSPTEKSGHHTVAAILRMYRRPRKPSSSSPAHGKRRWRRKQFSFPRWPPDLRRISLLRGDFSHPRACHPGKVRRPVPRVPRRGDQ